MKAYLSVLRVRVQVLLQYRAAAIAGMSTQIFWGLIKVMIFGAFFESSRGSQPMSYVEVVSYIWLSQAFFAMAPWSADSEIREMINSGHVAYELVRPVDLYGFWFMRAVAQRSITPLMRAVPLLIVAGLVLDLQAPPSLASVAAWIVALMMAVLVSASVSILLTISLLWTISGEGVNRFVPPFMMLLSGNVLPLPFFPDWMQPLINFLPFRGIIDVPVRFYLGHLPVEALPGELLFHGVWIVILVTLGRLWLARGLSRLVVQGG